MEEDGVISHSRGCGNATECTSDLQSQSCQNAGAGSDAIKVCYAV